MAVPRRSPKQGYLHSAMRIRTISLRLMLVAVAAIAFVLAHATRQARIASQLSALDPNVNFNYRYQYTDFNDLERYSLNGAAPTTTAIDFFGPDVVSSIVHVSSAGAEHPTEIAKLSSRLPRLRLLSIQDTPLRDRDLTPLIRLGKLRGLYLRGTAITDDSVATLSRMRSLQVLNLTNTSLSEAALEQLSRALPDTRIYAGRSSGGMM